MSSLHSVDATQNFYGTHIEELTEWYDTHFRLILDIVTFRVYDLTQFQHFTEHMHVRFLSAHFC